MRTLAIAGLASVFAFIPGGADAAVESTVEAGVSSSAKQPVAADPANMDLTVQGAKRSMQKMGSHRMGNMRRQGMRRVGGMQKRGMQRMRGGNQFRNGRNVRMGRLGHRRGYRIPGRGFQLPRHYINPSYFIGNFGYYGLSQPAHGYGWSRYYNDAVLTDRRGVVHDSVRDLDWDRYNQGYNDGYRDGRATYDSSVLLEDDRVVATPSGTIGGSATTYRGDWDGAYREDGSYQGEWRGTYQDAQGRVYEGNYEGTFIGEGDANQVGASYTDAPHSNAPHWGSQAPVTRDYRHTDRGYDVRDDELAYLQRCKKSSGIGGAVVGGAIGAFAGNRIAGRGNRLGGSLIGGGLGAVAGAAIDQ
ncbi:RcnB family protein, partial [Parasphingorhabdus sp.]